MLQPSTVRLFVVALLAGACAPARGPSPRDAAPVAVAEPLAPRPTPPRDDADARGPGDALQLVVVSAKGWDTTGGTLQRFERQRVNDPWQPVGSAVPAVIGRSGLAWDDRFATEGGAPVKREGDGRAPAGVFPLDGAFGFAPAAESRWIRIPYLPLAEGTECVDDARSVHYNTVVERSAVPRVDWTSAEQMRRIEQYRLGVLVGYNAAPVRAGRGSCIFLHVWAGPGTATAGCTAMPEASLREIMRWLRPERRPALVQLPVTELRRRFGAWALP